jgi:hypothetical protein
MPQYIITYLGSPNQMSPEEGQQHMAKYKSWLSDLGDAVISPANPIKNTKSISSDGEVSDGSKSSMSGYTIIAADTDDAALAIATNCPFLSVGGSLELSELIQMQM